MSAPEARVRPEVCLRPAHKWNPDPRHPLRAAAGQARRSARRRSRHSRRHSRGARRGRCILPPRAPRCVIRATHGGERGERGWRARDAAVAVRGGGGGGR